MTKKEAIKYLKQLYPNGGHCWLDEQRIEAIGMAVKTLQEEPVSEELEQAVDNYLANYFGGEKEKQDRPFLKKMAIHFAKWQKEQLMANTADATIGLPYENKDGGYTHLVDVSRPLPVGKNKIVIIFEENNL